MTERDVKIISMVYAYEGCGVEHVRQLFFPGSQNRSIPCYRRLAYLIKQQYLRSILLPACNKRFLVPGVKALGILAQLWKGLPVKRIRPESPLYIMHKLAICDVRVALEVAGQASSLFHLTEWVNESTLRQSPLAVGNADATTQTTLIPDACFTLFSRRTGKSAQFYLELDRSTVSLQAIRHRVRGYLLRGQTTSPVLFVVPDTLRQQAIANVALEEATTLQANPTTIWITQKAQIAPETVLAAPWVVVGQPTPITFQGLTAPGAPGTEVVARQGGHGA